MSDSDFVDVGDELVVRISGFPVGRAKVEAVSDDLLVCYRQQESDKPLYFRLPLNVKDYDTVDGVAHDNQTG